MLTQIIQLLQNIQLKEKTAHAQIHFRCHCRCFDRTSQLHITDNNKLFAVLHFYIYLFHLQQHFFIWYHVLKDLDNLIFYDSKLHFVDNNRNYLPFYILVFTFSFYSKTFLFGTMSWKILKVSLHGLFYYFRMCPGVPL